VRPERFIVITDAVLQQLECLERAIGNLADVPEDVTTATCALRRALTEWPRDPAKGIIRIMRRENLLILPNGAALDFGRRRALRPIVFALVDARLQNPGVPLSGDDIIRIGWPDLPIRNSCTTNRLWVAMARLRQLGLADYLVTTKHGWMLTTTVEFAEHRTSDIQELRPAPGYAEVEEEVEVPSPSAVSVA
jgi:hypothetical protein